MRKIILVLLVLAGTTFSAERRLLEVEEFTGLVRYPYHYEKATGWYARESNCRFYGAPGKGYHAQIHENARFLKISTALHPELPAGQYKVFLRVCGNSWHDKDNIVEVGLGEQKLRFSWQHRRKFEWLPGQVFSVSQPIEKVTLTAIQFGGKGFRQLYETSLRTLAVDTIYITSDLGETTGPTVEGSLLVEAGRDAPGEILSGKETTTYRKVKQAESPEPVVSPRVQMLRLQSYDGRRNIWPNSSFEIGGNDGWASVSMNNLQVHIFDERDHIPGQSYHGQYCLRIPAGSCGTSRPLYLEKPGQYTFSVAIRGQEKAEAKVLLVSCQKDASGKLVLLDKQGKWQTLAKMSVPLSLQWQRVSCVAELPAGLLALRVESAVDCFLDAVMLEPGEKMTDYQPRALVEAGLTTGKMGDIIYDDGPIKLIAWANNSGAEKADINLKYDMVDVREKVVGEGRIKLSVPAHTTISQEVIISQEPVRGLFSIFYHVEGHAYPEGELILSVLPEILPKNPGHALASNMDNVEEVFRLMSRMGHRWQLYCKTSRQTSAEGINPDKETWNWQPAKETKLLPESFGLKYLPCLWPTRLPKHLTDIAASETEAVGKGLRDVVRSTQTSRIPAMPDLKNWSFYCQQLGRNLPEIQWWNIEDETELYYTPKEFARIVKSTVSGFAGSGRQVRLSLSCTPDYTEDLIAELGRVPFHAFGGSSYNMEYWDSVKVRGLQRRYGLPWYCIGVGWDNQPQMYHSFPTYQPVYASAARTAREMVFLSLVQDARIIGHYTGRIWQRNGLFNTDFPLMDYTGVPLPHGFSYSCVGLLLANAEPVEDIYLEKLDTMIFVYRQNNRLGAVTWANNTPNLDIHWKTWPKNIRNFTVPAEIDVLDMYGNPVRETKIERGKTMVDLGEEPYFFLNRSMKEEEFITALKNATAALPEVEMRLVFLPGQKEKVDLGVWIANHTDKVISDIKLDALFPPDRMVSKTDWILKERTGQVASFISPGKAVFGRFPTTISLEYPVENATFTVWLNVGEKEIPWYERCWLTVAKRVKSKPGQGIDWSGVQPAWIYTTFSWGRFGRSFPQIVSGAENMKYAFRNDGRVALRAGYDEERLYLQFQVEDDSLVFQGEGKERDFFQLKFKKNLIADFQAEMKPDVIGYIFPESNGKVKISGLSGARGKMWRQNQEVYILEISLPLAEVIPGAWKTNQAIGFDFLWNDADREEEKIYCTLLRWAGGCRTFGQLFFSQ